MADERKHPDSYPGEFLRVVIGSNIHGLSVANTDDLDLLGLRIESPMEAISMDRPYETTVWRTQAEGHPSGPGDVDLTVHSLRKYLSLASRGNPTVLNALFVPERYRHIDSPLADELRALIPAIISKEAGARYLGYAQAQRERLLGLRGQKHTGSSRKQYYVQASGDKEPWDGKYGLHLCRLALQGIELLSTGHITLPMVGANRERLLEIRTGGWERYKVIGWSNDLDVALKAAITSSPLPEHPDRERLNTWLVQTYLDRWT